MDDEQSKFWSAVADKYDRVVDLSIGGNTRSMLRAQLEKEGVLGSTVEFGCGTGFFTPALAAKAVSVTATDLSPGMVAVARQRVSAANVTFQIEDCQRTSFADDSFDAAFLGLVVHFTEPHRTLSEMHRILKPGGMLLVANVDLGALAALDRVRAIARMLYQGVIGYRTRPPKRFGSNMLTEQKLRDLLRASRFEVLAAEIVKDPSLSSNIPIEYFRARKQ
jgi:ubiquinone/menaquinone biosynthesis C-methylase UbiE